MSLLVFSKDLENFNLLRLLVSSVVKASIASFSLYLNIENPAIIFCTFPNVFISFFDDILRNIAALRDHKKH